MEPAAISSTINVSQGCLCLLQPGLGWGHRQGWLWSWL